MHVYKNIWKHSKSMLITMMMIIIINLLISMSEISRQRILNVMGTFRPAFRRVAKSLTDIDLVLVEEGFERLLLDYDRVFTAMGVPACLWRRTGEIYKANNEFADLVQIPLHRLRDGNICIYEVSLMIF
jgi:hypothetical protein